VLDMPTWKSDNHLQSTSKQSHLVYQQVALAALDQVGGGRSR
jgi:hypothetical protein